MTKTTPPSGAATDALKAKPLGILGGGQLARMLALKCHELGRPVAVYSENKDDPAAQVVSIWRQGSLTDEAKLRDFLESCSVVTFESEFMDASLLQTLAKKTGTDVFPSPKLMGALQDRLTQKMLLDRHLLPTARFHNIKDAKSARIAFEDLGGEVVFKKRRFGYDGNGTFKVRSEAELNKFLKKSGDDHDGFIAETFIKFKREVAVIAARSRSGDFALFPFVETFQEDSRCLWVKGPLKPNTKLVKLGRKIEGFLNQINYVGVIGVELFETPGGYLVNELAPRVHNSGHYTLDATDLDQFSAHIMAVTGAHLDQPKMLTKGFAMMNLIGRSADAPSWKVPRSIHLHWYGKLENRIGRKMGHFNVLAASPAKALTIAMKARDAFDV